VWFLAFSQSYIKRVKVPKSVVYFSTTWPSKQLPAEPSLSPLWGGWKTENRGRRMESFHSKLVRYCLYCTCTILGCVRTHIEISIVYCVRIRFLYGVQTVQINFPAATQPGSRVICSRVTKEIHQSRLHICGASVCLPVSALSDELSEKKMPQIAKIVL
jgi:hypothetical protein